MLHMNTAAIRAKLEGLSTAQINRLAEISEVSVRTLWLIRSGKTEHASEVTREKLVYGFRHMPRTRTKKERE
jgi:hypothetical protein